MNDELMASREVRFPSGDGECAGELLLPAGAGNDGPVPVVVLAHGMGGERAQRLDTYAERFTARGYATLAFDYRHFAESTGQPRALVDIEKQLEDWRNAVSFARGIPGLDPQRVILWGTSFSGGHVIVTAAADPGIAATIAQCPFADGVATVMSMPMKAGILALGLAVKDRLALLRGKPPVRIPLVGAPGTLAILTSPDSLGGYRAILEASGQPFAVPQFPARIMLRVPRYRPGRRASAVKAPLLVCVCDRDKVTPAAKTVQLASRAARGEVQRYDAGHFDIYVGEWFEKVVADQIEFLERHVPARAGAAHQA